MSYLKRRVKLGFLMMAFLASGLLAFLASGLLAFLLHRYSSEESMFDECLSGRHGSFDYHVYIPLSSTPSA